MILTSQDGLTEFELRILKYQFPEILHDWDSNWLTLGVRVRTAERSWSAMDSCLLTWEAPDLVNWLADLAAGCPCDPELDFLEQDLSFQLTAADDHCLELLVRLGYGLLPPERRVTGWEGLAIPLRTTRAALRGCVRELAEEVRQFPDRGAWADPGPGIAG